MANQNATNLRIQHLEIKKLQNPNDQLKIKF